MRNSILLLLFVLSISTMKAQHWSEMMRDPTKNFYEIQAAFNEAWEGRAYEKGKGYKQFKRWEWFWEQRVSPSGEFPIPSHTYRELEAFKRANPVSENRTPANWTPIGPTSLQFNSYSPGIGRIGAVAQDPTNSQIIYVGTPGGGLWKSMNGGNSWEPKTDNLATLGVSGIAIDPVDPDIVYIGTGDGDADDTYSIGVLKSFDGGNTFESTGLDWEIADFRNINDIKVSPYDHNTLFAATDIGLYKSTDAGNSWYQVGYSDVRDIEFHPTNPMIVYAASSNMLRSENGGETFSGVTAGIPASSSVSRMAIAVSPDEPDWVYLLVGRSSDQGFAGIYRSTNNGVDFTLRADSPNLMGWSEDGQDSGGQAWYDMGLAVNPTNANQVFVGGVNLWRSNNGGSSWSIRAHWVYPSSTGAYVHADIHALEYFGNNFYCGSDGGIFKSTNNGTSFTDLTDGIQCSQFYRMGGSATNEGLMLAGAQDNGIILCNDGNCGQVYGADGMNCVINPINSNIMYSASQYGSIRKSTDGGNSFSGFSNDIPETGAWLTPFMLDPTNPNVLFAGYESLWKRVGNGDWTAVSTSSSNISIFNIAPSDHDVIYVGRGSSLSRTVDGGENWVFINAGLPALNKTSLEIHPTNPMEIWVTTSSYVASEKVFHSTDGGDTWENISYNLPNVPANSIVYEAGGNGGLYLGMDVGVFYTNDELANWVPFFDGLPNVVVSEVEIHYGSGKLRAATYGRGLWETNLFGELTSTAIADFSADQTIICEGTQVNFNDLSTFAESGWDWNFEGGEPATSSEQSPAITYNTAGVYEVSLAVANSFSDDVELKTSYITVIPSQGIELPYTEGYEGVNIQDSDRWFSLNIDSDVEWETTTVVGNGSITSAWINNFENSLGKEDELISNTIDLSGVEEMTLSFDVAYAQRIPINMDRLKFYISENCGETWILKKSLTGNSSLPTADPTEAPFIPTADQWNTITLTNIGPSSFNEDFRMRFRFTNDGGNNIYLDNININVLVDGLTEFERDLNLSIYPNPAQDQSTLRFNLETPQEVDLFITDLTGRELWSKGFAQLSSGTQSLQIPIDYLSEGMYIIQLQVAGNTVQRRFLKE